MHSITRPPKVFMNTGSQMFGRPSFGSWVTYGLGSETQDLPAFVVFSTGGKGTSGGSSNWGSGFLPSVYNGTLFRSHWRSRGFIFPIQTASMIGCNAVGLDSIQSLNKKHLEVIGDPEIATRINSFEMAYRMQSSAPDLMDLSKEPKHILDLYGVEPGKANYASACLLARRTHRTRRSLRANLPRILGSTWRPGRRS
jgi:hypothetical protein